MEAQWNNTQRMRKRLQKIGKIYLKNGEEYYRGRPIIHRGTEVDHRVYLGGGPREAIVVNSDSPILQELYKTAKRKATINGQIAKYMILESVFETVKEAMPTQDENAVLKLLDEYGVDPAKDQKIDLEVFIYEGVGVCRHDALACALLLEMFKRDGITNGKASVDRNSTLYGSHAWCRYENSGGEIFILDITLQKDVKRLYDVLGKGWPYERPEESLKQHYKPLPNPCLY